MRESAVGESGSEKNRELAPEQPPEGGKRVKDIVQKTYRVGSVQKTHPKRKRVQKTQGKAQKAYEKDVFHAA